MCNGSASCSSCSSKEKMHLSQLKTLPPGYVKTRVMFYSANGQQLTIGDNSVIVFNLAKPLNSVVGIEWTNTDLWYQLVAQPAIVSIDQLPNPNYTTAGVGYFAMIQSGNNFITRAFPTAEQPPRSYAQVTFRISDKTGALISGLTPWTLELEFLQKVNN